MTAVERFQERSLTRSAARRSPARQSSSSPHTPTRSKTTFALWPMRAATSSRLPSSDRTVTCCRLRPPVTQHREQMASHVWPIATAACRSTAQ